MMYAAFVVFVWIGSITAIATPLVYGLCNPWWKNYWGRTLLFKDIILALVYLRSLISILKPTVVNPPITSLVLVITVLMGLAMAANLTVMVFVTVKGRRHEVAA